MKSLAWQHDCHLSTRDVESGKIPAELQALGRESASKAKQHGPKEEEHLKVFSGLHIHMQLCAHMLEHAHDHTCTNV